MAQDFETVQAGEHHVQNHQVGPAIGGPLQPAAPFVLAFHLEAFAPEEFPQQGAQLRVIVHQQDAFQFNAHDGLSFQMTWFTGTDGLRVK